MICAQADKFCAQDCALHSLEEWAKPASREEGGSKQGEAVGAWVRVEMALIGRGGPDLFMPQIFLRLIC